MPMRLPLRRAHCSRCSCGTGRRNFQRKSPFFVSEKHASATTTMCIHPCEHSSTQTHTDYHTVDDHAGMENRTAELSRTTQATA